MVSPPRGLTGRGMGGNQTVQPLLGERGVRPAMEVPSLGHKPFASFHSLEDSSQHANGPDARCCAASVQIVLLVQVLFQGPLGIIPGTEVVQPALGLLRPPPRAVWRKRKVGSRLVGLLPVSPRGRIAGGGFTSLSGERPGPPLRPNRGGIYWQGVTSGVISISGSRPSKSIVPRQKTLCARSSKDRAADF